MADVRLEEILKGTTPLPPKSELVSLSDLAKGLFAAQSFLDSKNPWLFVFETRAQARDAIDNFVFFAGGDSESRVHYLPNLDFDYYRGILPNPEVLCERNSALFHALNDPTHRVFVTTISCLLQKVFPPTEYLRALRVFKAEEEVNRDEMIFSFLEAGYQRQPAAHDPGIFSVRGNVIDIFSPLYRQPLRFEFYGDFIEEIRFFDPQNQRSLEKLMQAYVIPVGVSLIPQGEALEKASNLVKERFDSLGIPKTDRDELMEKIKEGILPTENAFLFPCLSGGSVSVLDYFPKNLQVVWDGKQKLIDAVNEREYPAASKNHELFEKERSPVAALSDLFVTPDAIEKSIEDSVHFSFEAFASRKEVPQILLDCESLSFEHEREAMKHSASSHPLLESFARRFKDWMDRGFRIQIVCHTQNHRDRVQMLFEPYGIRARMVPEGAGLSDLLKSEFSHLNLWRSAITQSQVFPGLQLVILSEEEIFGKKRRAVKSAWSGKTTPNKALSAFRDLKVNDLVVHKDHGIGRYLGLKSMEFLGSPNDYVLLEYKDGDKLYIPVYRLNVVQKYVSGEGVGTAAVDKLGGDRWVKARQKAEKAVAELAVEFLKTHAKRKTIPAFKYSEPGQEFREFEMEFPFDETPDQMKSIQDVMEDMGQPHPMDRLICGDVGYGKTEVAMRAAYRAVLDGKQVAVLVPTTVLAFQHFETFRRRFKTTPTKVEMISRLRTSKETKQTLELVSKGAVDILIGTHRLLSADVGFKDLGLVVLDEEHRFGVVHKERLKKMCESVHVLSMTATPIPRTLNMAMTGIKEISIITTPPPDRLSVRTFVCRRSEEVVREAITNELLRDGQVFFVHNRIESIFKVAEELKEWMPKVTIEIAHGQMDGAELEKKMLSFYQGQANILLTTAIIESGLDIPLANTIIIDDADHFGLAQLYQLRGRVGRSEKRAYCYLLVPSESLLTADAKQRLQVIQRYSDLGSGFNIASHDLEIRGAGDLLGKEQSGHLTAIGIDLYFELLEDALRELKGQTKKVDIEPEINVKVAAYFPQDYLPDIGERITIYRRLSDAESEEALAEAETEIRDRFGPLPEEVTNLLGLMQLKMWLKRLHVVRLSCGPKRTSLQFAPSTPASPAKLVKLVQAKKYTMTPDQKLVFEPENTDWRTLLKEVQRLSDELGV